MLRKLFIPPVLVLLSIIITVVIYFTYPEYNLIPFPYNLIGIAIAFSGFVIMGKARDLFKKHSTTLAIEESTSLITEGVFAKSRNPMYVGMFLLLLGSAICFRNVFSIAFPIFFIILIRLYFIPIEEKMMLETFGQQYIEYKQKVRRWL